jgi:hypothetical protein
VQAVIGMAGFSLTKFSKVSWSPMFFGKLNSMFSVNE